MIFIMAWVPEVPPVSSDTTLGWFIESISSLLFILLPFHSALFH